MCEALLEFDRGLGTRYVCGADEAGRACWAGPLVTAAVRFDYHRLKPDAGAVARLEHLNDCKQVTPRRRAALLHPRYGFAAHKGYGTPEHEAALSKEGCLSPAHRRSFRCQAHAGLDLSAAA